MWPTETDGVVWSVCLSRPWALQSTNIRWCCWSSLQILAFLSNSFTSVSSKRQTASNTAAMIKTLRLYGNLSYHWPLVRIRMTSGKLFQHLISPRHSSPTLHFAPFSPLSPVRLPEVWIVRWASLMWSGRSTTQTKSISFHYIMSHENISKDKKWPGLISTLSALTD